LALLTRLAGLSLPFGHRLARGLAGLAFLTRLAGLPGLT
jgi:hypothetical protein